MLTKIILDSSKAINNNLVNPKWTLDIPIACNRVRLNSMILPLSYDTVNSSNNSISFNDNGSNHTATVPTGTYSPLELVTALQDAMSSVGQTYTVQYDAVSNRLFISAGSAFTIYGSSSASDIVGLRGDISGTSVTMPQPIDLSGVKLILIQSPSIRSPNLFYVGEEQMNIIACVPINQEPNTIMVYQNQFDTDFIEVEGSVLSTIQVQLIDAQTMNPIDLNGNQFVLVLDLESSGLFDDLHHPQ